ncbi:omptin family outer membrane protease [Spirochaeta africana]|uniref:Outer membrane protease n=1 Tax=Spirochaeta africana (strain ATCC 700263 / DSM 8902 / Z-7692) TaxID=889378 RepID=H9UFG5_SPIAZ|nr:omptin family outer membrane protease [Spirochaeta africana]AFG36258.1 outer membrane protease [Spirochaeta africana DSM 8902]
MRNLKHVSVRWLPAAGVVLLMLLSLPTAATELFTPEPARLRLEAYTGISWGRAGEYVYDSETSVPDADLLSQLDWDIDNVIEFGLQGEIELGYGIFTGGGFAALLPGRSGGMTDRDWIPGEQRLDPDDQQSPTHRSDHDNYVLGGYAADLHMGWRYYGNRWLLAPRAGYTQRYITFDARDGSYTYPSSSGEFFGTVISYRQHHRIPYIGVSVAAEPYPRIMLQLDGQYSPLVVVDAVDHHYRREDGGSGGIEFYDYPRGGQFIAGGLRIGIRASDASLFWVEITGELVPEFRGSARAMPTDSGQVFPAGTAGASLRRVRISTGISLFGSLLREAPYQSYNIQDK